MAASEEGKQTSSRGTPFETADERYQRRFIANLNAGLIPCNSTRAMTPIYEGSPVLSWRL